MPAALANSIRATSKMNTPLGFEEKE